MIWVIHLGEEIEFKFVNSESQGFHLDLKINDINVQRLIQRDNKPLEILPTAKIISLSDSEDEKKPSVLKTNGHESIITIE